MFKKCLVAILFALAAGFVFAACNSTGLTDSNSPYDDTELKNRIEQLEADNKALQAQIDLLIANSEGEEFKIYEMGETFTYISAGIPLFSIKVEPHPDPNAPNNYIHVSITNLNMPGFAPRAFVQGRYTSLDRWGNMTFSDYVLAIGAIGTWGGSSGTGEYLYLGFPTSNSVIIPYAIFRLPTLP